MFSQGLIFFFKCYLFIYLEHFFISLNKNIYNLSGTIKTQELDYLLKPESMGDLGLPNFQHYFWSAQMRNIVLWSNGRQGSRWTQIEAGILDSLSLVSLIFIKNFEKIKDIDQYFTVYKTRLAWVDCNKNRDSPVNISIYSPYIKTQT